MVALVVGRFQPVHKGHLSLLRAAIAAHGEVKVAVGSSQYEGTPENPFSFWDRVAMLHEALGPDGEDVEVFAVPDIHDPPHWVAHLDGIVGPYDAVYGNDDATMALFEAGGRDVVRPGLQERETYQGAIIRADMASGGTEWVRAVPEPVAEWLESRLPSMRSQA